MKKGKSSSTTNASFLFGGGEMGERMREKDWSKTPLGPAEQWPQSLKTAVRILLTSRQPMFVWWGKELINLYNDPYKAIVGGKHPEALGMPASEVWREIWDQAGPRAESALRKNEGTYDESLLLIMERNGYPEETYYTFSYSPIPDDQEGIGGIICANTDDTQRIVAERQLALLRELAASPAEARTFDEACSLSAHCLETNPYDLPFALIYLVESDKRCATLCGSCGLERGHAAAPEEVALDADSVWPFAEVISTHKISLGTDLTTIFYNLPTGAWTLSPHQAVVVPISPPGHTEKFTILVAGLNPFRLFDDNYRGFIELVAAQIGASIANAQAYEEERKRAETLAELDRVKTAFFSNVSHEFRTPLTLMLSPLDDILAKSDGELAPDNRELLTVVHRNGQRLLKLVNTLLDFSRIEAGRMQAVYEPLDLSAYTAELASVFRAAVEKAGMQLIIDCPPLPEDVYVDRDMWEKIILNLISNAFKFTLQGEIRVSLRSENGSAILMVQDTGEGIPEHELSNLFNRFHRVEGARGRTHEGTGIGLALVQELARLHGGTISVESKYGQGSTFTVAVPFGKSHLPPDRIGNRRTPSTKSVEADQFAGEALQWLPRINDNDGNSPLISSSPLHSTSHSSGNKKHKAKIVLADDNADMLGYVQRLLVDDYEVMAVADGQAALRAVDEHNPALVLTDVMMPNLDGFGLLKALRENPKTASIPVILLSARAGEEARLEGLDAGADDYLVKPFSARELLARVSGVITLARVRRERAAAEQAQRESEERFAKAFNASPLVLTISSLETGKLIAVNETFVSLSGYEREEAIGRTTTELGLWVKMDEREKELDTVRQSGQVRNAEYRFRKRNGEVAIGLLSAERIEIEGEPCALTVIADITEREHAQTALRESEERFRLATQTGRVGVWDWNIVADRISWSDSLYSIHGVNPGEFATTIEGFRTLIHPEDYDLVSNSLQRALEDDAPYEVEFRSVRPDGEVIWLFTNAMIVRDSGQPVRMIGATIDITDRKQAEESLREADRRKDEFLATLAHELRNPLAPIRNALQIIRLTKDDAEAVDEARDVMDRQLGQMVRLIDDLLDVSRISRGKIDLRKEQVNLLDVIRNAIETSRPLIDESGHKFTVSVPHTPLIVLADETRLSQVFANLLNNAAKYTDRNGHIRLIVEYENGSAIVSIRDDGVGIPSDLLPHVFEMFTQVDRSLEKTHGGLGIGLSIAKQLVEMHDGTIEVRSEGRGKGTEFIVSMPATVLMISEIKKESSVEQSTRPSVRRRILVADDNEDSAASMAMMLEILGNEVRRASDGLEAIEMAESFRPELMLLDIGMPELNGYDACRRIRQQSWGSAMVIAAMTGWGQEEDKRLSREAGFDHHLVKPVELESIEKLLVAMNSGQ
jgi:PAS domain S-box-containing protein